MYDHKIQLEQELVYGSTPLYRQSTEELRAIKEHLIKHLSRGFIIANSYPYASPVLFVKKLDSSLRFYINYRKLNALTTKDTYLIPRINKLLTRVLKAKILAFATKPMANRLLEYRTALELDFSSNHLLVSVWFQA